MGFVIKDKLKYYTFDNLEGTGLIRHGFSTRQGGVSRGIFSSLNLSYTRGDDRELVRRNYEIITSAIGVDLKSMAPAKAEHGAGVVRAFRCGEGKTRVSPALEKYDGLVTNERGLCLSAFSADCAVIFYLDKSSPAIGISHGGWRGTALGIGGVVVDAMEREFGSRPEDILAGISPSIGPCCFEVERPVADEFLERLPLSGKFITLDAEKPGKYKIDLWEINKKTLMSAGIPEDNIQTAGLCTVCNPELFYSHRAMGEVRGGLGGFIELKVGA